MSERVTFTRQGAVKRDGIRVGWIESDPDRPKSRRWRLRLTPASGMAGVVADYSTLREAKTVACGLVATRVTP